MNSQINIDDISENYQKFALEIISDSINGFFFNGTDVSNEDEEFFLMDHMKIAVFSSIQHLREYIINKPVDLIDSSNCINWAKEHKPNVPYAIFDFHTLLKEIPKKIDSDKIWQDYELLSELINAVNLIQDYGIQFGKSEFENILELKEIRILWEHFYDEYFWKKEKKTVFNARTKNYAKVDAKLKIIIILENFLNEMKLVK